MPKASPIQNSFNAGEWSPLLHGRADVDKYTSALSLCKNYVPLVQGPVTRRPGTRFVAEVKNSAAVTRLVSFEFSTEQAYIIEFGDQYCRFYKDNGQIVSGSTPYEIATPFLAADLADLRFAQSADVLFIAHKSYAPRKLSRTGHTSWTLTTATFQDGPFLPVPAAGSASLQVSASSGTVTITATSVLGINNDTGFQATDVGRMIRLKGDEWCWGTIATRTSTTVITATILAGEFTTDGQEWSFVGNGSTVTFNLVDMPAALIADEDYHITVDGAFLHANGYNITAGVSVTFTAAPAAGVPVHIRTAPGASGTKTTTEYRLGLWSNTTGWPALVAFFQNRLMWAGGYESQRIDGSETGYFTSYAETELDGTVAGDNALSYTLAATKVNAIQWLVGDTKGLLAGTVGAVWMVRASGSEALEPDNAGASQSSRLGSADVAPIEAGEAVVFVQRGGRRVRELAYLFQIDGFRSPDISLFAEHLFTSGVGEMVLQQTPQSVIWARLEAGGLLSCTYEREQDVLGWAQHQLGGAGDLAGNPPKIKSLAAIPSANGVYDELWLLVERYINGATVQYVEYLTKYWEDGDALSGAVFLDSSLEYSGAATATLTGLGHLEGQTIGLLVDGAHHPDRAVVSGSVTLDRDATKAQAGLKYASEGGTLPIDAGAADGTALGKIKRLHRAVLKVWNTLGLKTGSSPDSLSEVYFRSTSDPLNNAPPLFTGDLDGHNGPECPFDGDYDTQGIFYWRQDQPFPGTITAYMPQLVTQDG